MSSERQHHAVVEFKIFDRSYRLACDTDQKLLLEQAANEFIRRIQEVKEKSQGMGPEGAAIMAGINCMFELLEMKAVSSWDVNDVKQKIKSLETRLERCFYEQDNLF
ncbi:MAG: cell division protein ZapA [Ferrovum sp. 37-45-19]|uniref:cell division protein ZapA n=1 Tax=Ferrovum sp. JA12 TaxID=1356299 RepID=UPI0007035E70|nr:cell division protein ZapA [Ferrovum sp. JA12]OYV79347.1 MAG: cell division protein ZapA [Ferrovum sp. 21-44-67]OYV94014.1 MAG: cell division protein ZapA [Ferrovum sp. 37-45-19]OZB34451.1 MAG: cell division protein ZapA [Ferrovum sp. 34-44-207]HQT81850.1 cell division protein ZapA [Ferrovaceae bacterium]KRH79349.1 cell division protein ZapA [Ferrovum sp. JA12]